MNVFWSILKRDVALSWRQGGASIMVISFCVMVISLFSFGVGPEADLLSRVSIGVLWVTGLLASLLSLDRIFQADWEDGTLDQLMLCPLSLEGVVFAKVLAHWLTTALPLVVITPLLGTLLHLPNEAMLPMMGVLLLGSPALSFIGAIGAALTLSLRRAGILVSLLILPLYIPVLIFGVLAVEAALANQPMMDNLLLLAGLTTGCIALVPWVTAAALRINTD